MSDFQPKPNTGKAWLTSRDDKLREHERLTQYDWYNDMSKEEQGMKIPTHSGNLHVETDAGLMALGITVCKETNRAGNEQLALRVWQKKAKTDDGVVQTSKPVLEDDLPF